MRSCKRRRMNQESDFYQTPTDCSEEEMQRSCEFVKKLIEMDDDKRIFEQFVDAMKSYRSGSLTYIDLKSIVVSILRNHDVLLQDFHQLLSGLASPKSDVERTVEFLKKVQALGESVHKAFLDALWFPGDIEILVEQLEEVLGDHTSLRDEFKTFLIDSRLLKPKRDLEDKRDKQEISVECIQVSPSYWIRPEVKEGSSSDEVLNEKYFSVGQYDPEKVLQKKRQPWRNARLDDLEDKNFHDDLLLSGLTSVIEFGERVLSNKKLDVKQPARYDEVVKWFHQGKKVPHIFKTNPKLALQGILPELQSREEEMRNAKESMRRKLYNRVNRKG